MYRVIITIVLALGLNTLGLWKLSATPQEPDTLELEVDTTSLVEVSPQSIIKRYEADSKARIGIKVVRISDGATILSHRQSELFTPASVVKVLSTGAALRVKGVDYRFATPIYAIGKPDGATLEGGLLIMGSGDPSIGSGLIPRDTARLATELVQALERAGIKHITRGLYLDSSMPHGVGPKAGWHAEDIRAPYGAGLYGLNYRDNALTITATPIGKRGISLSNSNERDGLIWTNALKRSKRANVRLSFTPSSPEVRLTGTLASRVFSQRIAHPSPAHSLARALEYRMRQSDIKLYSESRISYQGYEVEGKLLHTYHSLPLDTLSIITNHRSQNLYAEAIASLLSTEREPAGVALTRYWHERLGLGYEDMILTDGSGLSRSNQITPQAMNLALLELFGGKSPDDGALVGTLPQVGKHGTVRNLFAQDKHTAYLKSGTMRGVSSYVGYVYHDDEWYAVTYLANGFGRAATARMALRELFSSIFISKIN